MSPIAPSIVACSATFDGANGDSYLPDDAKRPRNNSLMKLQSSGTPANAPNDT
jgi:hypothetical protein